MAEPAPKRVCTKPLQLVETYDLQRVRALLDVCSEKQRPALQAILKHANKKTGKLVVPYVVSGNDPRPRAPYGAQRLDRQMRRLLCEGLTDVDMCAADVTVLVNLLNKRQRAYKAWANDPRSIIDSATMNTKAPKVRDHFPLLLRYAEDTQAVRGELAAEARMELAEVKEELRRPLGGGEFPNMRHYPLWGQFADELEKAWVWLFANIDTNGRGGYLTERGFWTLGDDKHDNDPYVDVRPRTDFRSETSLNCDWGLEVLPERRADWATCTREQKIAWLFQSWQAKIVACAMEGVDEVARIHDGSIVRGQPDLETLEDKVYNTLGMVVTFAFKSSLVPTPEDRLLLRGRTLRAGAGLTDVEQAHVDKFKKKVVRGKYKKRDKHLLPVKMVLAMVKACKPDERGLQVAASAIGPETLAEALGWQDANFERVAGEKLHLKAAALYHCKRANRAEYDRIKRKYWRIKPDVCNICHDMVWDPKGLAAQLRQGKHTPEGAQHLVYKHLKSTHALVQDGGTQLVAIRVRVEQTEFSLGGGSRFALTSWKQYKQALELHNFSFAQDNADEVELCEDDVEACKRALDTKGTKVAAKNLADAEQRLKKARADGCVSAKFVFEQHAGGAGKLGYTQMVFAPELHGKEGVFNLFMGYVAEAYPEADPRGCAVILDFIRTTLANGDEASNEYILDYLAWLVQNPARKAGVALAFRSTKQGTGKNTFWESFMQNVLGDYLCVVAGSSDHVLAKFNSDLCNRLLCLADEISSYGGLHKSNNELKNKITQNRERMEVKGVDAAHKRDLKHWVFLTNNWDILKVEEHDRRYALFQINESRACDKGYLGKLRKAMRDTGALKHLFDTLRERDISQWDPRNIPSTPWRRQQQAMERPLVLRYLQAVVDDGLAWCPRGADGPCHCEPTCQYMGFKVGYDTLHAGMEAWRKGLADRSNPCSKKDMLRDLQRVVSEDQLGGRLPREFGRVRCVNFGKKRALADALERCGLEVDPDVSDDEDDEPPRKRQRIE
jgi:hypothetical protein